MIYIYMYIYVCMIHIPMMIWINDVYIYIHTYIAYLLYMSSITVGVHQRVNGVSPTTEVELGGPDNTLLKSSSPGRDGGVSGGWMDVLTVDDQLMIYIIHTTTMYPWLLFGDSRWLKTYFLDFVTPIPTWENDPSWRIFFRWVGSTTSDDQLMIFDLTPSKFNSKRPWKVTGPQKERIVFQASFFSEKC